MPSPIVDISCDVTVRRTARASLPPAYTTLVVRRGIGAMPQFTPTELTDAELAELARWLEYRN